MRTFLWKNIIGKRRTLFWIQTSNYFTFLKSDTTEQIISWSFKCHILIKNYFVKMKLPIQFLTFKLQKKKQTMKRSMIQSNNVWKVTNNQYATSFCFRFYPQKAMLWRPLVVGQMGGLHSTPHQVPTCPVCRHHIHIFGKENKIDFAWPTDVSARITINIFCCTLPSTLVGPSTLRANNRC